MSGLSVLKGMARGLTADVVGAPVDLATILVNSGLAAGGYLGHKLGLLRPDQMPNLIEKPIGGSDWFADKTPLADDKTAGYTAGRFTGNLLPGIGQAARSVRLPQKGQVNALYPGGDDSLAVYHATSADRLLLPTRNKDEILRPELFHTSWGITREGQALPPFGDTFIVPRAQKLEPRLSPTVIRGSDFYSPRYNNSWSGGGFVPKDAQKGLLELEKYVEQYPNDPFYKQELAELLAKRVEKSAALDRLRDRFGHDYPKGGFWGEGWLPTSAKGAAPLTPDQQSLYQFQLSSAPRFQSWKHYESSPQGAGRLIPGASPQSDTAKIESLVEKAADRIYEFPQGADYGTTLRQGRTVPELLLGMGSPIEDMPWYVPKDQGSFDYFNRDTFRRIDSIDRKELRAFAHAQIKKLKNISSEYGEAKTFGPTPFNRDNIAGVVTAESDPDKSRQLRTLLEKQGIPAIELPSWSGADEKFGAIRELQNAGFARDNSRIFMSGMGKAPESTPIRARVPLPQATLESKFFNGAGLNAPSAHAQQTTKWLFSTVSENNLKDDVFAYLPEKATDLLEAYAAGVGNADLGNAVKAYLAAINEKKSVGEVDAKLMTLVKAWDKAKSGIQ